VYGKLYSSPFKEHHSMNYRLFRGHVDAILDGSKAPHKVHTERNFGTFRLYGKWASHANILVLPIGCVLSKSTTTVAICMWKASDETRWYQGAFQT